MFVMLKCYLVENPCSDESLFELLTFSWTLLGLLMNCQGNLVMPESCVANPPPEGLFVDLMREEQV